METKEIKINVPEGFEIDKGKSTFEKIVFKKKETKRWRNNEDVNIRGYFISTYSNITPHNGHNIKFNYNLFATEKLAKAALATARISQIMTNDERYGGPITSEEWKDAELIKYVIIMDYYHGSPIIKESFSIYHLLAFHTKKEAELFLEENRDLVCDYFMVED